MSVRNRKRAAVWMILPALVLLCCTGCKKEEQDTSFSEIHLEEDYADESSEKDYADESSEEDSEEDSEGDSKEDSKDPEEEKEAELVFVHVCGAVVSPGVYGMEAEARVYEAVSCAGGLREDAAGEAVNQAQKVTDGERIYIPTREEVEAGLTLQAETDMIQPEKGANGSTDEVGGVRTGNTDGKLNINTASFEELKTLNGIGDTRAESILKYREEHGGFQTIEDLMNVEGIKEGVFEKIKDRITVNTGS